MHVASHDLFNMKLRTCLDTGEDKVAIYPICNKCKMQGLYFGCNVETLFEKRFQIL
jgi:hypothetical protein